ncbi:MAG: ABC transporter permease [Acidobacteriia bacterium]|nr:ABC transporter permease [Terriglobia bacterium]
MRLFEDVRFGLRTMAKTPTVTLVSVLTLALGIGVNATVFALTNAVLFKGFPFDRSDRIVYMGERNTTRNQRFGAVSYPDFRDWQARAKSFKGLAAANGIRATLSDQAAPPESYQATQISANGFRLIGQKPAIGRDFTSADAARGAAPVVLLGYGVWERRYGKDASVIGRKIRVNSEPATIIGVMPKDFVFPFNQDFWMPLVATDAFEKRESRFLIVYGRMADGVNIKAARAEMDGIGHNLSTAYPLTNREFAPVVQNYNEFYIGPQIAIIFESMLVAVAFVLLIACANIANLMLARAGSRSREISVRIAVGAGRWRIIRQLLVESVMLSSLGGLLGWLIAIWGTRAFAVEVIQFGAPKWLDFSMDYRAFLYLALISIGTGIAFGLAPAVRLSRLDFQSVLKDGGRGSSIGRRGKRFASVLVVSELALAMVLLTGAGLMMHSFLNIYNAHLGVKPDHILTMRLPLPNTKYGKPEGQIAFHDQLKQRLAAIPGVDAVGISDFLPTGGSLTIPYEFAGAPPVDERRRPTLSLLVVSPDYFRTVDAPILSGRAFTEADTASGPRVTIVNQRFASKFWPGQDPLGKRIRLFDSSPQGGVAGSNATKDWLTVIGVVPNIVQNDITPREIDALIYVPYRQKPAPDMAILAKTRVPPGSLGSAFRQEIQQIDPDLPVYNLWTLNERLERNYWYQRMFGVLFLIFGGIALLLASLGLYASMAYSVSQRTQEIGIRMAVGATESRIHRLVFGQGLRQLVIGLCIGIAGAFAVTRVLKSVLVQVSPSDPVTFIGAALVLSAAAAIGCLIPARRAMRVDPIVALYRE